MRRIPPLFALILCCAIALPTLAAEMAEVPGSKTQFPVAIETTVAGKKVKMVLTGTAMRKRLVFNVYALASYVQDGSKVTSADELASLTSPKRLELVMERDVGGKDMAEAFETAIRANYPQPMFGEEMKTLVQLLQKEMLNKEDRVWLTYLPEVGLHIHVLNKKEVTIKNVQFGRAIWDIYLGKNNISEVVKKGLVSRVAPH